MPSNEKQQRSAERIRASAVLVVSSVLASCAALGLLLSTHQLWPGAAFAAIAVVSGALAERRLRHRDDH